jgi:hypothetical protein
MADYGVYVERKELKKGNHFVLFTSVNKLPAAEAIMKLPDRFLHWNFSPVYRPLFLEKPQLLSIHFRLN